VTGISGKAGPLSEEEVRQARLEALHDLGLSRPMMLGPLFGPEGAYCLTCGALVPLVPADTPGELHAPQLHYLSHHPTEETANAPSAT
jgi:hypothetical protein